MRPQRIRLEDFESTNPEVAQRIAKAAAELRSRRPEITDVGESIDALGDEIADFEQKARDAGPPDEKLFEQVITNGEALSIFDEIRVEYAVDQFRSGNRRKDEPELNAYGVPTGQVMSVHASNRDLSLLDVVRLILEELKTNCETATRAAVENERRDAEQVRLLEKALAIPLLSELFEITAEFSSLPITPASGAEMDSFRIDPRRGPVLMHLQQAIGAFIETDGTARGLEMVNIWRTFGRLRGLAVIPDNYAFGGGRFEKPYKARIPSNDKPKRGLFTNAFKPKRTEVART